MEKKFEYKVVNIGDVINGSFLDDIEKTLNTHGMERWELVSVDTPTFIFKREINES